MRAVGPMLAVAVASVLAGALASCGSDAPNTERATVIDSGDGRAMLCLEGVMESYPPQCAGDIPVIEGWDWSSLEHEEAGGVRWGEYRVTGERQGDVFVLSEPPEYFAPGQP